MPVPSPPADRVRRRRRVLLGLLPVLVGVAGWLLAGQVSAWVHLDRGRAALDRGDPADARRHLEHCLATWPDSAEAHFLAAQAARRTGDFPAARRHLDSAERLRWVATAVDVERTLVRAQTGDFAAAEPTLRGLVGEGYPDAPHLLAVLVPGYMAEYRMVEAEEASRRWVELEPASARAWALRADILERLRRYDEATDAVRRAVELDPDNRAARLAAARLLVRVKRDPVAAEGYLAPLNPDDPDVLTELAACRRAQGRADEAAALLDRVLAVRPDSKALHLRGQVDLDRGRPADAVPFLRRAAEAGPADTDTLYTLARALRQAGSTVEAVEVEERWARGVDDFRRVTELTKAVAASPRDPNLRREAGELLLRNGQDVEGVRWLESALRVRPDHAPTHRALAAYHERAGRFGAAAFHRARAEAPSSP